MVSQYSAMIDNIYANPAAPRAHQAPEPRSRTDNTRNASFNRELERQAPQDKKQRKETSQASAPDDKKHVAKADRPRPDNEIKSAKSQAEQVTQENSTTAPDRSSAAQTEAVSTEPATRDTPQDQSAEASIIAIQVASDTKAGIEAPIVKNDAMQGAPSEQADGAAGSTGDDKIATPQSANPTNAQSAPVTDVDGRAKNAAEGATAPSEASQKAENSEKPAPHSSNMQGQKQDATLASELQKSQTSAEASPTEPNPKQAKAENLNPNADNAANASAAQKAANKPEAGNSEKTHVAQQGPSNAQSDAATNARPLSKEAQPATNTNVADSENAVKIDNGPEAGAGESPEQTSPVPKSSLAQTSGETAQVKDGAVPKIHTEQSTSSQQLEPEAAPDNKATSQSTQTVNDATTKSATPANNQTPDNVNALAGEAAKASKAPHTIGQPQTPTSVSAPSANNDANTATNEASEDAPIEAQPESPTLPGKKTKPTTNPLAQANTTPTPSKAPKGDAFSKMMAQIDPLASMGDFANNNDPMGRQDIAQSFGTDSNVVRLTGLDALGRNGQMPQQTSLANSQALAAQISKFANKGETRFEIRLDPADLGKVDVRLTIGSDGQTRAHLFVERSETLDFLMRDQRFLERSLQQNGLSLEKQGLEFSLMDQKGNGQNTAHNQDEQAGSDESGGSAQAALASDDHQTTPAHAHPTHLATNGLNLVI